MFVIKKICFLLSSIFLGGLYAFVSSRIVVLNNIPCIIIMDILIQAILLYSSKKFKILNFDNIINSIFNIILLLISTVLFILSDMYISAFMYSNLMRNFH